MCDGKVLAVCGDVPHIVAGKLGTEMVNYTVQFIPPERKHGKRGRMEIDKRSGVTASNASEAVSVYAFFADAPHDLFVAPEENEYSRHMDYVSMVMLPVRFVSPPQRGAGVCFGAPVDTGYQGSLGTLTGRFQLGIGPTKANHIVAAECLSQRETWRAILQQAEHMLRVSVEFEGRTSSVAPACEWGVQAEQVFSLNPLLKLYVQRTGREQVQGHENDPYFDIDAYNTARSCCDC